MTALGRYTAHLAVHLGSTDREVVEATKLPAGTIKFLRHQHPELFRSDGGRPARWRLKEQCETVGWFE